MNIHDCNCCFGDAARPPFRYARTAEELIAEMDFCGIQRALAYHAGMRFDSPVVWNDRLVEEIRGFSPLGATWAILPSQTGEQRKPEEFLAAMRSAGVRALRAFPDEHRCRLDKRTFGDLLPLLVERRIPLLVKQNILSIGDLLKEIPGLVVVAMNVGPHSLERYLRPLMDEFPNLYVETSHYMVEGLIEESCVRYGPGRLLFGSGYPDVCSGAALLRLAQADIPPDARAAIAGGNLERMLEAARP